MIYAIKTDFVLYFCLFAIYKCENLIQFLFNNVIGWNWRMGAFFCLFCFISIPMSFVCVLLWIYYKKKSRNCLNKNEKKARAASYRRKFKTILYYNIFYLFLHIFASHIINLRQNRFSKTGYRLNCTQHKNEINKIIGNVLKNDNHGKVTVDCHV